MKINFRDVQLSDTDFVLQIENNKSIWKVSHTTTPFTHGEIEAFITQNIIDGLLKDQKRWIITINDLACGCIDLFDYNEQNGRAGLGIVIHQDYQNRGIASIALEKFIDFCRTNLKLHQVYCSIISDNIMSIKLFTKKGFIETGIRKEWTYYKGEYFDELFYQLKL